MITRSNVYFYPFKDLEVENIISLTLGLLTDVYSFRIEAYPLENIPSEFYNAGRMQYNAELIAAWLSKNMKSRDTLILGILDIDAYVEPLNFVFGVALPYANTATVYLPRLKMLADKDRYRDRIKKEILHEVGHVLGLSHCINRRCAMCFSNSVLDVDYKLAKYCRACASKLSKYGIEVNEAYIIS